MINNAESYTKIVTTHISRLNFAIEKLSEFMPVDDKDVANLSDQQFMYFEVLTTRFSKLQDYLGSKIFDLVLLKSRENTNGLSMIDKLNQLEKIGAIESVEFWDQLRDLRNHLTHEYPDNPELTSRYLNKTYSLSKELIQLSNKMIEILIR